MNQRFHGLGIAGEFGKGITYLLKLLDIGDQSGGGNGIRIEVPHWLLVISTLTAIGWILIWRKFGFEKAHEA